jgi:hypothetical protein
MDFAMRAFPGMPGLFLYRDPAEVIASVLRETSAVLWAKGRRQAGFMMGGDWRVTQDMGDVEYLARCFAHYLDVAARDSGRVAHVNYKDINPANFPAILARGLNFKPDSAELALMLEQFRFHSKDDNDQQLFKVDSAEKLASMSDEDKRLVNRICGDLVARLDRSASNLFAPTAKHA